MVKSTFPQEPKNLGLKKKTGLSLVVTSTFSVKPEIMHEELLFYYHFQKVSLVVVSTFFPIKLNKKLGKKVLINTAGVFWPRTLFRERLPNK